MTFENKSVQSDMMSQHNESECENNRIGIVGTVTASSESVVTVLLEYTTDHQSLLELVRCDTSTANTGDVRLGVSFLPQRLGTNDMVTKHRPHRNIAHFELMLDARRRRYVVSYGKS